MTINGVWQTVLVNGTIQKNLIYINGSNAFVKSGAYAIYNISNGDIVFTILGSQKCNQ